MVESISNNNEIKLYLHCAKCIDEGMEENTSVGWTVQGIQVWCNNHNCNIAHIDFEGQRHPANISRNIEKD
jgi:hypothetical protein